MTTKSDIDSHLFHPFEIAFCGFSNSGKTTLISKILARWKNERSVGYAKHDVHRFQMDKQGKDTYVAWENGAHQVQISDPHHTATIHHGPPDPCELKTSFLTYDAVILEGYKNSPAEKIVVIDPERTILERVATGDINRVIAFVGADSQAGTLPLERPYFQRDDIDGISRFIDETHAARAAKVPLYGLVLTGGRSKRMGQDKALLKYGDRPQAAATFELLSHRCQSVFLSSRRAQWREGELAGLPQIHDRFQEMGPLGGILSAMQTYPQAAWLVVACDLPFVDAGTIDHLIDQRAWFKLATCFKSDYCEFPEPLCSIYEPRMRIRFFQFLGLGHQCPRKALIQSPIRMLEQPRRGSLDNVNTKDEFLRAKTEIGARP